MSDATQHLVRLAMELQQAGDFRGAKALYEQVLEAAPDHPDALHLSGLASLQLGDFELAVLLIQQAVDRVPDHPVLRNNLGLALHRSGALVAAAGQLQKALDLREGYAGAHMNLGAVYSDLGDREGALEHGLKAVELEPERAECWFNLGLFQLDRVELPQTLEAFRRALTINPQYAAAATSLLYTLNLTPGLEQLAVLDEHQRVCAAMFGAPAERPDRKPGQALRLGFVSADFRHHAVNHFFEPLLAALDREGFHITCFSDTAEQDEATHRLKGLADNWLDSQNLNDDELKTQIRKDKIDVLIDLAGHTKGNRLAVFARRPARLQLGWLGYPAHPGLQALDAQLVDNFTLRALEGTAAAHGLVSLGEVFACFRPAANSPALRPPPSLARGYVTLGSLHKLEKINQSVIACWAKVLQALPDSRLLLARDHLDPWQRQRLLSQFKTHGIDEGRLQLMGAKPEGGSFQDFWAEIDIYLDTFPWSGHTMACHALWCGVPVVTLAGKSHASRMVGSVLAALDLEAWVAESEQGYVEIISSLAEDSAALTHHRETLRQRMASSPVMAADDFARQFERCIREQLECVNPEMG